MPVNLRVLAEALLFRRPRRPSLKRPFKR